MDSQLSNDASRSSELITESPAQEGILPDLEDGSVLEPEVSRDEVAGDEPAPGSTVQAHVLPDHKDGPKLESNVSNQYIPSSEPTSKSPTQEHLCPRTQEEAQQLSVSKGVHQVVSDDGRQAAVPSSRIPAFYLRTSAGWEVEHLWNRAGASQTISSHDPRNNAPGTTFDTTIQRETYFPASQTMHFPLPRSCNPYRSLINAPHDRWSLRPKYTWIGLLPHPNESPRWEDSTVAGQPRRLTQGPTRPLGPPLKPFDGPRAENIAQDQWDGVMVENEMRQALERARTL